MWVINFLAVIGTILGILKGITQAYHAHQQGHAQGMNGCGLWAWFLGGICLLPFAITSGNPPLLIINIFNIFSSTIVLWYYYFPKLNNHKERLNG